jgi:nucleotide-binding universal stress UspA family protein
MFQRILVPLDGSSFSEISLPCAEEMAGRMNSQLILLNVIEPITARYENTFRYYLDNRAEDLKRHIIENGGCDVSVESLMVKQGEESDVIGSGLLDLAIGHPAADIIAVASSQKASLILMATHGYSGFQQFTLSNVADTIIRHCSLPVMLIRPGKLTDANREVCRNVVVPLDGSQMAEKSISVVEEMADKLVGQEMKVHFIHVVQDGHKASALQPSATFLTHIAHPAWHMGGSCGDAYFKKAEEYLEDLGQVLTSRGVNLTCTVCPGKPEVEIPRLASETCAGLVVMCSHSRMGLARLVIGSVADRVLRTVDASLLFLRPEKL